VYRVSQSRQGSFEWLFTDEVPFKTWLSDDGSMYEPIFWITGKPGSGKSTLMRLALDDGRTTTFLPPSRGHSMAYFFHLRGKALVQKSLQGMLTELLYQTLNQFPEFYKVLKPIYAESAGRTAHSGWDLAGLLEGFSQIPHITSSSSTPRARLLFFIDALDENQDQKENKILMRAITGIAAEYEIRKNQPGSPLLKICLASRPWPFFKAVLGGRARIPSIAIDQYTTVDIRTYTQRLLLQPLSETHYSEDYRNSVLELSTKITSQAKGVFVWVRVVVDNLHGHIVDGTPLRTLEKILMSYPDELDELYEYTIRRIPTTYQFETEVTLKTVLESRKQLTLGELYGVCHIIMANIDEKDCEIPKISTHWLASRSGGLLETTPILGGNLAEQHDAPIQFIHQTVQEFVRQGIKGLADNTSLSGSYFLASASASIVPWHPSLFRIYEDAFDYLRSVEHNLEIERRHVANSSSSLSEAPCRLTDALLTLTSAQPLPDKRGSSAIQVFWNFFQVHLHQRHDLFTYIMPTLHSIYGTAQPDLPYPEFFHHFLQNYMPILQNLYLFGENCFKKPECFHAFVAALGPRLSLDRVDRVRMLSRVLHLQKSIDMEVDPIIPEDLFRWSICNFIPLWDAPSHGRGTRLIIALCCALPGQYVDDETLLALAEVLLSNGASTATSVLIRLSSGSTTHISLLHFVTRFKSDKAWLSLMLRYGAELFDYEFTLGNQPCISASLGQAANKRVLERLEELLDRNTIRIYGVAIPGACAVIGAMLANISVGDLQTAHVCLDIFAST
jgi:hypothetical protein